jgi:hypothetical protein
MNEFSKVKIRYCNLILTAVFRSNRNPLGKKQKCVSINNDNDLLSTRNQVESWQKDGLHFPGVCLKPLSHLSTKTTNVTERGALFNSKLNVLPVIKSQASIANIQRIYKLQNSNSNHVCLGD